MDLEVMQPKIQNKFELPACEYINYTGSVQLQSRIINTVHNLLLLLWRKRGRWEGGLNEWDVSICTLKKVGGLIREGGLIEDLR